MTSVGVVPGFGPGPNMVTPSSDSKPRNGPLLVPMASTEQGEASWCHGRGDEPSREDEKQCPGAGGWRVGHNWLC